MPLHLLINEEEEEKEENLTFMCNGLQAGSKFLSSPKKKTKNAVSPSFETEIQDCTRKSGTIGRPAEISVVSS